MQYCSEYELLELTYDCAYDNSPASYLFIYFSPTSQLSPSQATLKEIETNPAIDYDFDNGRAYISLLLSYVGLSNPEERSAPNAIQGSTKTRRHTRSKPPRRAWSRAPSTPGSVAAGATIWRAFRRRRDRSRERHHALVSMSRPAGGPVRRRYARLGKLCRWRRELAAGLAGPMSAIDGTRRAQAREFAARYVVCSWSSLIWENSLTLSALFDLSAAGLQFGRREDRAGVGLHTGSIRKFLLLSSRWDKTLIEELRSSITFAS